jgi:hypothetical protein
MIQAMLDAELRNDFLLSTYIIATAVIYTNYARCNSGNFNLFFANPASGEAG